MTALKPRFTNSMRLLPLMELFSGGIARTRPLCVNTCSSLSRRANTFSRLSPLFFLLSFLVTCCSSLDSRREEDFSFFFQHPAVTALQDPRHPCPYHSLGFYISSNECTWNVSAIHREHAFVYMHLGLEPSRGEILEPDRFP